MMTIRKLLLGVGVVVSIAAVISVHAASQDTNVSPAFEQPQRSNFPFVQVKTGQVVNWGIPIVALNDATMLPASPSFPKSRFDLYRQTLMPGPTGLTDVCVGWPPCPGTTYPTKVAVSGYHIKSNQIRDLVVSFVPQNPGIYLIGPLLLHWKATGNFPDSLFSASDATENLHQFVLVCVQVDSGRCLNVHRRIWKKIKKYWRYWEPSQRKFF